jgi:Fe2+ or Zn2+ uptake regulation protein
MIKMITNRDELKAIITAKGLKPTHQRILILDYLRANRKRHPTAEQIHEALSRRAPTLSLTTVYNTLGSFVDAGIIYAITITGTETRYEWTSKQHHHLLCKRCGHIFDIDIECPNAKRKSIQGYKIDEVHGYFKGICKSCLQKQRKQN